MFKEVKISKEMNSKFESIDKIFYSVLEEGRTNLTEVEAYDILKIMDIPIPEMFFHKTGSPVQDTLDKLDSHKRYVLKAVHPKLLHKTDEGALAINIGKDQVEEHIQEISYRLKEKYDLHGFLISEFIPYHKQLGNEFIIGSHNDVAFGTCMTIGFGGTATEYFKEVFKEGTSCVTLPVRINFDNKFITENLNDFPLIQCATGKVRGRKKLVEFDKILEIVSKIQQFLIHYSLNNVDNQILVDEFEMNPLIVKNGEFIALDAILKVKRREEMKISKRPIHKIKNFLAPESLCIAGVSGKNPANPANVILSKFLDKDFDKSSIYILHPKETELYGLKCYPSMEAIKNERDGKPLDLLIIGTPVKIASGQIKEAIETDFSEGIQIISAGFGETKGGTSTQNELEKVLRYARLNNKTEGPVINGPNTVGNCYYDINTIFTPEYKAPKMEGGKTNCALITQSGGVMLTTMSDLAGKLNPLAAIGTGNQMDLTAPDFLEFLLDDKNITTYGLYIEGLTKDDGLKLMRLAEKAKKLGKFVIVYKAGMTKAGADAAKGHTASLAGDYSTFKYLMELSGVMVASTFQEFQNLFTVATLLPQTSKLRGKEKYTVAALSNGGFEKCAIADHVSKDQDKVVFPGYSEKTKAKLKEVFDKYKVSSIMDFHDVMDLSPMIDDAGYEEIIRITLADKNVDFGIYSAVPDTIQLNVCEKGEGHNEDYLAEGSLLNRLIKIRNEVDKPFVFSLESGAKYNHFADACFKAGIPCFRHADGAGRVIRKLLVSI